MSETFESERNIGIEFTNQDDMLFEEYLEGLSNQESLLSSDESGDIIGDIQDQQDPLSPAWRVQEPIAPSKVSREFMRNANCEDVDPDVFFPNLTDSKAIEQAKQICRRCSEQTVCLEFALSSSEEQGVWGGLTEDEREELIRSRRNRGRQVAS